jgi:hypothetical protein
MNRLPCRVLLGVLLALSMPAVAQRGMLSVCDYQPPESRISDLGLQGSFSWYDGPYADDRNRAISASVLADYAWLFSSDSFGQSLDTRTEIRGANEGWSVDVSGSGSLLAFLKNDVFGVGVVGVDASTRTGWELDLTGGIGTGRFRDVSPLAQAIRIQNDLLDLGELLAPMTNDALLEVAQILGEIGSTDDEKVVRLVERLLATGLVSGADIGIRGLLAIEEILQSGDETRLCGSDAQARLGASVILAPEFRVAATGIVLLRLAAVPDPVSQFESNAQLKMRLARPEEMILDAGLSYSRRLPDGWTARSSGRVSVDRMWSQPGMITVSYLASGSLMTKILGAVGLSVTGKVEYRTGDEELTVSLAVYLEADLL